MHRTRLQHRDSRRGYGMRRREDLSGMVEPRHGSVSESTLD